MDQGRAGAGRGARALVAAARPLFAIGYRVTPPADEPQPAFTDLLEERIWRWDGSAWAEEVAGATRQYSGATRAHVYRLTTGAMWGAAPDDGWASLDSGFRWDGRAWRRGGAPGGVRCFWGTGTTDVWAFEAFGHPSAAGGTRRWDGTAWTADGSAAPLRCGAGEWRDALLGALWRRRPR